MSERSREGSDLPGLGTRPEFWTQDPWLAGYLNVMGCQLMRVEILPNGKARWVFPQQPAVALGDEYRTSRAHAVAPIPAYREAYKEILRAADAAREGTPIQEQNYGQHRAS